MNGVQGVPSSNLGVPTNFLLRRSLINKKLGGASLFMQGRGSAGLPGPGTDDVLDLFPLDLPEHPGHTLHVGIVEVDQSIENMTHVLDPELRPIPGEHVGKPEAVPSKGEEIDEILLRSPLDDRRQFRAGNVPERREAALIVSGQGTAGSSIG